MVNLRYIAGNTEKEEEDVDRLGGLLVWRLPWDRQTLDRGPLSSWGHFQGQSYQWLIIW